MCRHVSATDKIGKLYRNQANFFAIDDANDEKLDNEDEEELVNLKVWLDKPDMLNRFKCFYREKKKDNPKSEWIPGYELTFTTQIRYDNNKKFILFVCFCVAISY